MPKSVLLMVGHWNIENITSAGLRSWRSASALSKSTGSAGERDYHWNQVMPRLRDKLIAAGVQVFITDAIYREEIYKRDYDLMLCLHYDGGGTGDRCMASAPNPATAPKYLNPAAQTKAQEFVKIWAGIYPAKTKVTYAPQAVSAGMLDYYGYDYAPLNTPTVLAEHFNSTSPRGRELITNPELVAQAEFEAVSKFLGLVPAPVPQPPVVTPPQPSELDKLKAKLDIATSEAVALQNQVKTLTDDKKLFTEALGKNDQLTRQFVSSVEAVVTQFKKDMGYVS